MKNVVKILSMVLVVAMLFCLGACGGDKGETTTTTAAGNTTEAPKKTEAVKVIDINLTDEEYAFGVDKAQPELLASVNSFIAEIKANGKFDEICNKYFGDGTPTAVKSAKLDSSKDQLVVATNAAFEPFEYTKGEDYYGVDMEIAALLAEKLGKELVISNMEFNSVCLSVGEHKCDIAMAGLTVKPDREEYVAFSTSYYTASQKIIVKGDDTSFDACKTAADVEAILNTLTADTKIGVQTGTTGQFYVEGDESWDFAGFKATCTGYSNGSLAVQDLINGGVKYVIIDAAPASFITKAINALH
ncbi:MAG: transporter substrate-binding domain-containing protein [Clostridiales bacterium]|nr:transporter substrate-binding domain-containing protein [Clostridiales bacterium]